MLDEPDDEDTGRPGDEALDEALEETFPASDPLPSFRTGVPPQPRHPSKIRSKEHNDGTT